MSDSPKAWPAKVGSAVLVLVVAAIGAEVAAGLLVPLIPALIAVVGLVWVYRLLLRR